MSPKIAIKAEKLTKTFMVPLEKRDTMRSYFVNPFHRSKKSQFKALDDVSFEVETGTFLSIVGRNGSGKSTLLKLIAGVYNPEKGKIKVNGTVIPFLELGVGFNPELSGRENIYLNGVILGMRRLYVEERFDQIVDFAGVGKFLDLPLKNYSSGMMVKLAFAIAIQSEADIYLLDEVLAVGDAAFQEKSLSVVKELKRKGKTIVFVSHSKESVLEHSDEVLLLDAGKVVMKGEPEEVLDVYEDQILNQQNISSREKIEKVKKDISIGKVEVHNKSGKTTVVKHGEEFQFRISVKRVKDVLPRDMKVGIGIYSADGEYVYGVNTRLDDVNVPQDIQEVSFRVLDNKLLNGKYFANVSLFGKDEKDAIDFAGRAVFFRVEGAPKARGVALIKHTWGFDGV